jgi:hypothetical protein
MTITDAVLLPCIVGVVTLALGVDLAALLAWLMRAVERSKFR